MGALSGLILCAVLLAALWGMVSLQASLMASSRAERLQEEMQANAALDAAIAYQPEPGRTLESLVEQVNQMELRLRALEGKVG